MIGYMRSLHTSVQIEEEVYRGPQGRSLKLINVGSFLICEYLPVVMILRGAYH